MYNTKIDNTTAISYINRIGGIQYPRLNKLTRQVWRWCEERDLWIFASYIKSNDNIEPDKASRFKLPVTEWELAPKYFKIITKKFGFPSID